MNTTKGEKAKTDKHLKESQSSLVLFHLDLPLSFLWRERGETEFFLEDAKQWHQMDKMIINEL